MNDDTGIMVVLVLLVGSLGVVLGVILGALAWLYRTLVAWTG